MATVGQILTTPEAGWIRVDDINPIFSYSGSWDPRLVIAGAYGGSVKVAKNTIADQGISFRFKGTKIRLITRTHTTYSPKIEIVIDGISENFVTNYGTGLWQVLGYEKLGLDDIDHIVTIRKITSGTATQDFYFDAVDIDIDGKFYHIHEVFDIKDLSIGKRIRCNYEAVNNATVGTISNFGLQTSNFPTAPMTNGSSDFYATHVDNDFMGRKVLMANSNIATGISWNLLNEAGLASTTGAILPDYTALNMDNGISLSYNPNGNVNYSKIIVFNEEMYVIFDDSNTIRVKKYNGVSWVMVNNGTPLNYEPTSVSTGQTDSIVFNNELYVTWFEMTTGNNQLRAKKFNGTSWVTADNNTIISSDINLSASFPSLAIHNNELYISFTESPSLGDYFNVRVMKFNGTSWITADNNTPLNYSLDIFSNLSKLISFSGELYITFYGFTSASSPRQLRVKKFNGTSWVTADNNTSLNYDVSQSVDYPSFQEYNNELYIIFLEDAPKQLRIKKFNGTSWVTADNNTSLNYLKNKASGRPSISVLDNELYIIFTESYSAGYNQLRAKKFNGTSWASTDGNTSMNFMKNQNSFNPSTVVFNNKLHFSFSEYRSGTPQTLQLRAKILEKVYDSKENIITVRLPVGNHSAIASDKSNDWDKYIAESNLGGLITPGDDSVWNWLNTPSLMSTSVSNSPQVRIIRGGTSVVAFASIATTAVSFYRPIITIGYADTYPKFDGNIDRNIISTEDVRLQGSISDVNDTHTSYNVMVNGNIFLPNTEVDLPTNIDIVIPNHTFLLGANVIKINIADIRGNTSKIFNVTLFDTEPSIIAIMTGMTLDVNISDIENDKVQYLIKLNGVQVFPETAGNRTELAPSPQTYRKVFISTDVLINQLNTVTVEAWDRLDKKNTATTTFIGEYSGMMFSDMLGTFYTTDVGLLLKYLDMGILIAGQTSSHFPIRVVNKNAYPIQNIQLLKTASSLPAGVILQISKTDAPFVPDNLLLYGQELQYDEFVVFYVRILTTRDSYGSGVFEISTKSDPND